MTGLLCKNCGSDEHKACIDGSSRFIQPWAKTVSPHVRRLKDQAEALSHAAAAVVDALDPVTGTADDATEVALASQEIAQTVREALAPLATAVLLWLARNEGGVNELLAGELKFWGDRGTTEKVRDMPEAALALFAALEARRERAPGTWGVPLIQFLRGDAAALEAVKRSIDDLMKSCVSKGGLKTGAAKRLLGESFDDHWDTVWGDRLAKGEPAKKLGVANTRFLARHARATLSIGQHGRS